MNWGWLLVITGISLNFEVLLVGGVIIYDQIAYCCKFVLFLVCQFCAISCKFIWILKILNILTLVEIYDATLLSKISISIWLCVKSKVVNHSLNECYFIMIVDSPIWLLSTLLQINGVNTQQLFYIWLCLICGIRNPTHARNRLQGII